MIAQWIQDTADRLETASEIVRELNASSWIESDLLRQQLSALEDRLYRTSQRLGILRSLSADTRHRYVRTLEGLHSAALACLRFACGEECVAAYEGIDSIASELAGILVELETLEQLDTSTVRSGARSGGSQ